jgi:hypothetical protein
MTSPNGSAAEAALVDQVNSTVGRIQTKSEALQNSINGKIGWLPSGLQDAVISGWNRFCGLLSDIWDALADILGHLGSPGGLTQTADLWSRMVGGPVSEKVLFADSGQLTVDTNWSGTAADAYRNTLPYQKAALAAIKASFTDPIGNALTDLATGIRVFWGSLIAALVGLAAGIVAGLASAGTIVGLPATPFIIVGAGVVAGGLIASGEMVLGQVCSTVKAKLQQKLDESTGFPDGHWPPATVG